MSALLILFCVIALFLNIKATFFVQRDAWYFSMAENVKQLLLVWLVPILGAVIVIADHRSFEESYRQKHRAELPDLSASEAGDIPDFD